MADAAKLLDAGGRLMKRRSMHRDLVEQFSAKDIEDYQIL